MMGIYTNCVQLGSVASGGIYTGGEVALVKNPPGVPQITLSQFSTGGRCYGLGGCNSADATVTFGSGIGEWTATNVGGSDWVWSWAIWKITVVSGSLNNGWINAHVRRNPGAWEGGVIKMMAASQADVGSTHDLSGNTTGATFVTDIRDVTGTGDIPFQMGWLCIEIGPGGHPTPTYSIELELVDIYWHEKPPWNTDTVIWTPSEIFTSGVRLG